MQPTFDANMESQTLVSILTRPEGRVQRRRTEVSVDIENLFQSSPGQKAGCNVRADATLPSGLGRFNPHPAAGALFEVVGVV